jgi:hypothetical protein
MSRSSAQATPADGMDAPMASRTVSALPWLSTHWLLA